MKNLTFARACLWTGIFATIGLISCSEQENLQPPDSAPKNWETHLQYALSQSEDHYKNYKIALTGYEYRGTINTEIEKQLLIDEMFADNTYTLVYNGKGLTEPTMETWGNMRKKIYHYGEKLQANIESDIVIGETEIINLEWKIEDMTYHSIMIADKNGEIIYDNIGTYAIVERVSIETRGVQEIETRTDAAGNYRIPFKKYEYGANSIGITQWEIILDCYSYFNKSTIILTEWTMRRHANPVKRGWTCDAKIKHLSGEPNVSYYHEFIWGYAYGDERAPATVQDDGSAFYFNDTCFGGETGKEVHRAPIPEHIP